MRWVYHLCKVQRGTRTAHCELIREISIKSETRVTRTINSEHEPSLCEYEVDFAKSGFQVFAFTVFALWKIRFPSSQIFAFLGRFTLLVIPSLKVLCVAPIIQKSLVTLGLQKGDFEKDV